VENKKKKTKKCRQFPWLHNGIIPKFKLIKMERASGGQSLFLSYRNSIKKHRDIIVGIQLDHLYMARELIFPYKRLNLNDSDLK
jgi:predicted protein tyrosine phosphatase